MDGFKINFSISVASRSTYKSSGLEKIIEKRSVLKIIWIGLVFRNEFSLGRKGTVQTKTKPKSKTKHTHPPPPPRRPNPNSKKPHGIGKIVLS